MLGENILRLRKSKGISQEQLGEKVEVTRQTISNWELGDTMPNPNQLKLLSKALCISIDELLDNEVNETLIKKINDTEKKVNNTEKLSGIIIKILKAFGIAGIVYITFIVIAIVSVCIFAFIK